MKPIKQRVLMSKKHHFMETVNPPTEVGMVWLKYSDIRISYLGQPLIDFLALTIKLKRRSSGILNVNNIKVSREAPC